MDWKPIDDLAKTGQLVLLGCEGRDIAVVGYWKSDGEYFVCVSADGLTFKIATRQWEPTHYIEWRPPVLASEAHIG